MKAQGHSTPGVCPETSENGETVSIYVDYKHPLLQLKRALPWVALCEVMTRRWAAAGKNTDGRPGLPWDVVLYVPLVVLMCVKNLHAREMEAYLAENVVARVFIGRQGDLRPQIRDHSNIARAYAALAACRREKSASGLNGSWGKNRRPVPKAVARLGRLGTFHHWFCVLQAS